MLTSIWEQKGIPRTKSRAWIQQNLVWERDFRGERGPEDLKKPPWEHLFPQVGKTHRKHIASNFPKALKKEAKQVERSSKKATWKHTGKHIWKTNGFGPQKSMTAVSGVITAGACGSLFWLYMQDMAGMLWISRLYMMADNRSMVFFFSLIFFRPEADRSFFKNVKTPVWMFFYPGVFFPIFFAVLNKYSIVMGLWSQAAAHQKFTHTCVHSVVMCTHWKVKKFIRGTNQCQL